MERTIVIGIFILGMMLASAAAIDDSPRGLVVGGAFMGFCLGYLFGGIESEKEPGNS
jgi:hypothetical protein